MNARVIARFERRWMAEPMSGCWLWLGSVDKDGYGKFSIGRSDVRAHRFAYALRHGATPDHLMVCHHCDNPGCVNPDHLFLGNVVDNARDRENKKRGNQAHSERNGRATLTNDQVREIRAAIAAGESQRAIGARYGVHQVTISRIKLGKKWGSVW